MFPENEERLHQFSKCKDILIDLQLIRFEEDENGDIILWNKKEDESYFDLLVRRMSIIQSYIEAEKAYDYLSY